MGIEVMSQLLVLKGVVLVVPIRGRRLVPKAKLNRTNPIIITTGLMRASKIALRCVTPLYTNLTDLSQPKLIKKIKIQSKQLMSSSKSQLTRKPPRCNPQEYLTHRPSLSRTLKSKTASHSFPVCSRE